MSKIFEDWVYSNNIKHVQRKMNSLVRKLNKSIEQDDVWKGRFFARQVKRSCFRFEDGSGAEHFYVLRFYDIKTLKYIDYYGSAAEFSWGGLFFAMNSFIVDELNVNFWEEKNTTTVYTDIPKKLVIHSATPFYNEDFNTKRCRR